MFAVVDIAGHQYKVQKDQKILAPKMEGQPGDQVEFNQVLMVSNEGDVKVGVPVVEGSLVKATIVKHTRGKKVIIFKKKRRKGYKLKRGHKQEYTAIKIDEIV
ncbi:50S ribosomal protein L21 [candidate division KSB1 bacterium]|nr:50S ribosomal protein L21 [candidate division KSB1 bacterium]